MMKKKISLTGGIASGKSTVAQMFCRLGAKMIDADQIAHQVIEAGNPGYEPVIETFGSGILNAAGQIDRKKLRQLVFTDSQNRAKINAIIHPLVRAEMNRQCESLWRTYPDNPVIHDIPLLIETGLFKKMDIIILVYLERQTQIKRLAQRDSLSEAEAEKLLTIQMPLDHKRKYATFIVDNSGAEKQTFRQVKEVFKKLHGK
ncbi:dephospho-CoA kinase [candidate division CSSED10-310 bacterium]|uniref:Dephospho-CoA kinase n=1 Tax=candidate division CSSED10-310 bacterium TaxID=2855610 RepID=A0ABV6YTQ9_UNCC1